MTQLNCPNCGKPFFPTAKLCAWCAHKFDPSFIEAAQSAIALSERKAEQKARVIGVVVALAVFAVMFVNMGNTEETGGRVRLHWLAAAAYVAGGKVALSAFIGVIAGLLAWLFMPRK